MFLFFARTVSSPHDCLVAWSSSRALLKIKMKVDLCSGLRLPPTSSERRSACFCCSFVLMDKSMKLCSQHMTSSQQLHCHHQEQSKCQTLQCYLCFVSSYSLEPGLISFFLFHCIKLNRNQSLYKSDELESWSVVWPHYFLLSLQRWAWSWVFSDSDHLL